MRRKTKKILIISACSTALLLIFLGITVWYAFSSLNGTIGITEETYVTIPQNATVETAMKALNEKGLFKPGWIYSAMMKYYSKSTGKKIFAGCYRLLPDNTNLQLLKALYSGNQLLTVKVTYPEGITLEEFAAITEEKLGTPIDEFMKEAANDSIISANKIPGKNLEGYLMPDTYEFSWKQAASEIIKRLFNQHLKVWNERFASKARNSKLTKHEILTLASIVESESPLASERPRIAGVYKNRLQIGMNLCADPTVQYALAGRKKLTYSDLEYDSPYNTYKYPGLPPGPICSPSTGSINAAIESEKNNYLYFVAIGDGSSRHNFAVTDKEHARNVAIYKRNRKK